MATLKLSNSVPEPARDSDGVDVDAKTLDEVQAIYESGLYVKAYERAREHEDLTKWRGTRALVLASRLANNLGAPRFAALASLKAFRQNRTDADAIYYAAATILNSKGPLASWRFLKRYGDKAPMTSARRADLLGLIARILSTFRDFRRAEQAISEAERLSPGNAWIQVEKSYVLKAEDRYEESFTAAAAALAISPRYRPAIQAAAQALTLIGRDAEAESLVAREAQALESASLWLQRADMEQLREAFSDALASYAQYERCSPMLEPGLKAWLAGVRARTAHRAARREESIKWASEAADEYHARMAKLLSEAPSDARRVMLKVDFVRQHHMTCAPACITMIGNYWGQDVDQDAVVREICYDGTEDHKERRWALDHGYRVREFSMTWASVVSLIDRGVPFFLNTQETASAHLQIVTGYDEALRIVLIRDPYTKKIGEFQFDALEQRYLHNGPRAMVIVPMAKSALIDDLELLDERLYDLRYELRSALAAHKRSEAVTMLKRFEDEAPGHWMTLSAQLEVARYSSDGKRILELTAKLYALNEHNKRYLWLRLSCLKEHAKAEDRIALLRKVTQDRGADTVFLTQLADELGQDRRRRDEAKILLNRAIAQRPGEGGHYWHLSEMARVDRDFPEALELARFAACLDDKNEQFASSYFIAARYNADHDVETAAHYLTERCDRLGSRSGLPAKTLFWALDKLDRTQDAFATLERALTLRPKDGELMLYAAERFASYGRYERADELLLRAEGQVSESDLCEAKAQRAESGGRQEEALGFWLRVAQRSPSYIHAHHRVATLEESLNGRRAALQYWHKLVLANPDNRYFRRAQVEWLRDQDTPQLEAALLGLIEVQPSDAWARRELAMYYAGIGSKDAAMRALEEARPLDPESPGFYYTEGYVLKLTGDRTGAMQAFLRSMSRAVDSPYSISQALAVAGSHEERVEILHRYEAMLLSEPSFGDGIRYFHEQARSVLDARDLLRALTGLNREFSHVALSWSALARHQTESQDLEGARATVSEALRRFPLATDLWLAAASLAYAADDSDGEEKALLKCLETNPSDNEAARRAAQFFERIGKVDREREILQQALKRNPTDQINLGYMADVLWRVGEKHEAVQHLKSALRANPRYDWAWQSLKAWSEELGNDGLALSFVDELIVAKPDVAYFQLARARILPKDPVSEVLSSVERALQIAPDLYEAHEFKIERLVAIGEAGKAKAQFDAASLSTDMRAKLGLHLARTLIDAKDLETATATLEDVLAISPVSYEAWRLRADALSEQEKWDNCLECCLMLTKLEPKKAASHGYLGEALEKSGDVDGAIAAYRAALTLLPEYEFAACHLIDLLNARGATQDAEAVLEAFPKSDSPETEVPLSLVQRAAEMSAARRDEARFEELLLVLAGGGDQEEWRLARTIERAEEKLTPERMRSVLAKIASRPNAPTPLLVQYGIYLGQRKAWTEANEFALSLKADSATFACVAAALLRILVEKEERRFFLHLIRAGRDALHRESATWMMAGYGYTSFGLYREAISWFGDWRTRHDAEPWALSNLAKSLRNLGRFAEAAAVAMHAAKLHHKDHATTSHQQWAVIEMAVSGDDAGASAMLGLLPKGSAADNAWMHRLAEISAFFGEDLAAAQGSKPFGAAWERLRRLKADDAESFTSPANERAFWRLAEGLARRTGLFARSQVACSRHRAHLPWLALTLLVIASQATRIIIKLAAMP